MAREVLRLLERERQLLEQYYDFYYQLAEGLRSPTNEAQLHFVAVCHGTLKPATEHESAYLNFRRLARLAHMTEHQVADYSFAVAVPLDGEEIPVPPPKQVGPSEPADFDLGDIDEFGEGVPRPGWFTDEGWRRMRGGYRFDSR
jgi:hypothetical protein